VSQKRTAIPGTELVLGINAVREVLLAGSRAVETLYCHEHAGSRLAGLEDLARQRRVPVKRLPKAAMDRLAAHEWHQGVILKVSPADYCPLGELLTAAGDHDLVVALDGITDPQNLGSIIRTAAAAGVKGIILPERRAAGITATVARIASGGLEYLRVCRVKNLVQALEEGRRRGFWVAGAVAAEGQTLYQADLRRRLIVVLGAEDRGIRPLVRKNCDFLVTIPLHSPLDSLNVGTAAAVILFEVKRQQLAPSA